MIASENYTSPAVLAAQGSVLTNKYAEGYPGRRYYGGRSSPTSSSAWRSSACEAVRRRARQRAAALRRQANMAVYFACLDPGDTVLAMDLAHGGHLTHGMHLNFSGKLYQASFPTASARRPTASTSTRWRSWPANTSRS